MTTTNLSLNVTIEDVDPLARAGVFADLTELATNYSDLCAGVSVSAYAATDQAATEAPGPTDDDLGRIAYDAHVSTLLAAELVDTEVLADFDDQHPDHRNAWIQAALAARNA